MKIYISGSGALSKAVADKLSFLLEEVLQQSLPYVFMQNPEKKDHTFSELATEPNDFSTAIICVTKENIKSEQLCFEAGILFQKLGKVNIHTLLVDVNPLELTYPFKMFQTATLDREEVFRLVQHSYVKNENIEKTKQELDNRFDTSWKNFENDLQKIISTHSPETGELQAIGEELLLPVVYKQAHAGDLETVFNWLKIAKSKGLAGLEGQLGFAEASLARIMGKSQATKSLQQLSMQHTLFSGAAQLEWLLSLFGAGRSIKTISIDFELIGQAPLPVQRSTFTILSLWHLCEKNNEEAKQFFKKAAPEEFTEDDHSYYRSVPMGILCFAFGKGEWGERYFDLVRSTRKPNIGYPYLPLLSEFDRLFVNTCIGHEQMRIFERHIRRFRGHAWVLIAYAGFLRTHNEALQTLASRTVKWKLPLKKRAIADKLLQLQKRLTACSGVPLPKREMNEI